MFFRKKEQIHQLSKLILDALTKKGLAVVKVEAAQALARIERVFQDDMAAEKKLNQDAEALLQQYRGQLGSAGSEREMLQKIKKQLAKERKMVL